MADIGVFGGFDLPFQEQIDFFRQKLNLPTERWDDIWQAQHDRAFVVAGAMKADLLDDLRQAVDKAISEGTTLETFRKDFRSIVEKNGWHGWTGEGSEAGFNWRTKVIYETNLRSSYAAGRWAQLDDPGLKKLMPFKRYVHNDSVLNPRPLHKAWHGLTLPADHPFWNTHFAPNGWGCRCRIVAAVAPRKGDATEPPAGWDVPGIDGTLPGIDKGWGYAPGASARRDLADVVKGKVAKLPPKLGKALADDVASSVGRPAFVEAKTAKAAAEWAVKNNLADFADYAGIKPEVANDWNRSLFEHLQEFPELRKNQRFVGSAQAQFAHYATVRRQEYAAELVKRGFPADVAKQWADNRVRAPKVKGTRFAQSWQQKEAAGIAVNTKWGGSPAAFKQRLVELEAAGWFPPGCNTFRSVVDHEIGHQLDSLLGLRLDNEVILAHKEAIAKGLKTEVSGYAEHNNKPIAEFIAECWSESCNNPAPRDAARVVAEIVRARYRARFNT